MWARPFNPILPCYRGYLYKFIGEREREREREKREREREREREVSSIRELVSKSMESSDFYGTPN